MLPFRWRVTKYNPQFRDASGAYLRDDWTSVSDIGREYGGRTLDWSSYRSVERAYVDAVIEFAEESDVDRVIVDDWEAGSDDDGGVVDDMQISIPPGIHPGASFSLYELKPLLRAILREAAWGKFSAPERFYVHFGHDYYMYMGSAVPCRDAIARAQRRGLFVEDMSSPYS